MRGIGFGSLPAQPKPTMTTPKTRMLLDKCSNCTSLERESQSSASSRRALGNPYRLLLQLGNDRALLPVDERFSMRAVAQIEPDGPGRVFIHNLFSVRRSRFQVTILKEHNDHVFVMEMHWRGDTWSPGGIPNDHAVILKYFLGAGTREGQRVTALVFYRSDRMIF